MAKRSKKKVVRDPGAARKISAATVAAPSLPGWLSSDWFWALVLFVAIVLAYTPVWWAGYIWDDDLLLTENPVIVGPQGLKEIWTTIAADICPLTITTFWVEHALWGLAPLPYHLVNVVLHGVSALLLWHILRILQIPGAWLGAALWAMNPVMVESVAWITEMKNTESGLFYLLAILFFIRHIKTGGEGARKMGWNYGLMLLFAAMAIASKSSTVVLPLILCLCAWWIEGHWRWRHLLGIAPIFLMSIAAGLVSMWIQHHFGADDPSMARSWPLRLAEAGDAAWFYLGKLIWPYPLVMIYPQWQIDATDWMSYLPLVAGLVVLFVLWFKRESWGRPWFFALAYFLAVLLPVIGLLNMKYFIYTMVADHFQYLAGIGPMALAGAGIFRLSESFFPGKAWPQTTSGALALLLFGVLSWQQAWVYQGEQTLWTDTLAYNPTCWVGYNNLGMVLVNAGKIDDSIPFFQKSLQFNPGYDIAENNLGGTAYKKKDIDAAIAHYRRAVELKPGQAKYHSNLGIALTEKGQTNEAIAELEKALELDPSYTDDDVSLGMAFVRNGRLDDAIAQFQKRLDIYPEDAKALNNLGAALFEKGQCAEAIVQFQAALRSDPNYSDAQNNLAIAQAKLAQPAASKNGH